MPCRVLGAQLRPARRGPNAKSAIWDYAEQRRHKSDPMEVDEMAYPAGENEGDWGALRAVGHAMGKAKGQKQGRRKCGEGLRKSFARAASARSPGQLAVQAPKLHRDGHKAVQCCNGKEREGARRASVQSKRVRATPVPALQTTSGILIAARRGNLGSWYQASKRELPAGVIDVDTFDLASRRGAAQGGTSATLRPKMTHR